MSGVSDTERIVLNKILFAMFLVNQRKRVPVLYNRYVCVPGVFERTAVSVFVVYVINTVVP